MRIKSRAGSFNMSIDNVTVEDGELIMLGKMGVWSARTMLSAEELEQMLKTMTVSARVIDFAALFVFRYLRNLLEGDGNRRPRQLLEQAATPQGKGS